MTGNTVLLITIFSLILLSAYKAYLNSKSDMKAQDKTNDNLKNQVNELKQEISDIKERTMVLEKIVTSENYDLKSEINSL